MFRKRSVILNIFLLATLLLKAKAESEIVTSTACEFKCSSGECIPKAYVCNGLIDCKSRQDEQDCDVKKCEDKTKFFKCRDGGCISKALICDDQGDCKDYSDESDEICPETNHTIRECDKINEFECSPGICIPLRDKCDGIKQCINGKDEDKEMCKYSNVTCDGFHCKNGICLNNHDFICDGTDDCGDGSDEEHCIPNCELSESKFMCKSGDECISLDQVCNGDANCHDKSDEGGKCNESNLCTNFKCDGTCKILPEGPKCICKPGFSYNNQTESCNDINECDRYGICSQQCVNQIGSYYCTCANGFMLNKDGKTCDSTSNNVQLLYTSKKYVKKIYLNTNFHELIQETRQPAGITFDGENYYWTEVSIGKEAIVKMNVDSIKKENILTNGLDLPEDIAVDWLTKNIYFTDSKRNHIAVCTNDGYYCTELVQSPEMQQVRSIALHPLESLLFWTDWGKNAHIGVSFMDGSDAKILINNVAWPNGITLDWPNGRIYWIDALQSKIESSTIKGTDRRVILQDVFKHPFAIAVYGNRLYWSDTGTKAIEYCDKFTGKNHDVLTQGYDIFDIHIYDKNQMPQRNHACNNNPCSHLCLLSKNNTYTCACPVNMELKLNKRDCIKSKQSFSLIFGVGNYVTSIPHQVFGRVLAQETMSIGKYTVDKIEYNSIKESVFVADNTLKVIIEFNLNSKMSTELVNKDISYVSSMSFDYNANNLYWSDKVKNTIEIYSLTTKKRAIIQHYTGDYKIAAIALIPSQSEMFVVLQSSDHTHIDRQSMKGDLIDDSHHHVIESGLSSTGVINLAVDEVSKKLFWSDSNRQIIEYSNFDGTERKSITRADKRRPHTLALIKDDLYWSSQFSRSLQWRKKNLKSELNRFQVTLPDQIDITSTFINIASGSPNKMSSNPCLNNSGGCSDICISDGDHSSVCKCAIGYDFINSAKKICAQHNICDFRCDSGECIEASKKCDKKADCIDGSDEKACDQKTCRMDEFKCKDGECIDANLRCNGNWNCKDKSDEENCNFKCFKDQIKCPTMDKCVNISHVCDLTKDCPDGYDENAEMCKKPCPPNNFRCISGQCIPKEFECDSRQDCADGSDEHDHCPQQICKAPNKPCKNGFCISEILFCDGHDDCPEGFDEQNCDSSSTISCDVNEFKCMSNQSICISYSQKCDGFKDCPGGEDERDCPECPPYMYECDNGDCIDLNNRCDGKSDCADHSDENHCEKINTTPQVCLPGTYRCSNGMCLDYSKVCDDKQDCNDDEGSKCDTACKDSPCDQLCKSTPKGAVCDCETGYKLKSVGDHVCEDIDECLKNPCSQICSNTPGSFVCSCHDGYHLNTDRTTCKAIGGIAQLFYIYSDELRILTERNLKTVFKVNGTAITDYAVDAHAKKIILAFDGITSLAIFDLETENLKLMDNVPLPQKIIYDWMTENVYVFSGAGFMNFELFVCNMNKNKCILLKKFKIGEIVRSAEIDPINGFIFYVLYTPSFFSRLPNKIIKMRLDGTESVEIHKDDEISALSLDIDTKQIFFTSVFSKSLQSINYEGGNKKTYVHQSRMLKKPIGLSIFENKAYIIDSLNAQLILCKLYDNYFCVPVSNFNTANAIKSTMVHEVMQKKTTKSFCENNHCEEICIPTDIGKKCLCDENGEAVTCSEMNLKSSEKLSTEDISSSSNFWLWTFFILLLIAGVVAGTLFVYRRRGFNTKFNISTYFKNNEIFHEFTNNSEKQPSTQQSNSIYPRAPSALISNMGKNYEVINNDYDKPHYENLQSMQNFSDEELGNESEFNNDPKQRLIV